MTPMACAEPVVAANASGRLLDPHSRAVPIGWPEGVFADGWARARASFRFHVLDAVSILTVALRTPPGQDALGLSIGMHGAPSTLLTMPPGVVSVVEFSAVAAAGGELAFELNAGREGPISAEDAREAAYRLLSIGLY